MTADAIKWVQCFESYTVTTVTHDKTHTHRYKKHTRGERRADTSNLAVVVVVVVPWQQQLNGASCLRSPVINPETSSGTPAIIADQYARTHAVHRRARTHARTDCTQYVIYQLQIAGLNLRRSARACLQMIHISHSTGPGLANLSVAPCCVCVCVLC